jgi:hypothetical protein
MPLEDELSALDELAPLDDELPTAPLEDVVVEVESAPLDAELWAAPPMPASSNEKSLGPQPTYTDPPRQRPRPSARNHRIRAW